MKLDTRTDAGGVWSATMTNDQQTKTPIFIGLAVGIGALLWLGPFMGLNSVLNPAKLSNIMGGSGAGVNNFLALLGTLGAVTSTITTIIIGALSDLTRSRWGRRTPWILSGSVLTAAVMIGLGMVNFEEQLPLFIVLWCLLQTFINFIVAPLIAVIADRVAPMHRGMISSVYAAGYIIGQYGGPVVGGVFLNDANPGMVNTGYYVLAFVMLLSGPVAAIIMREKSSLNMPKTKMDWSSFVRYFVFPVHNALDLYLALFGKMLINIAVTAFSVYQLFFLTSGMGLDQTPAGKYISLMGIATMVTALIFAPISGPISDKLKTRKKPVALSALLIAAGTLLPFIFNTPASMLWYGIVAGIGSGIFFSVDQALNLEVLPNAENAAKDLGILNFANTGAQILGPVLGAILFDIVGGQYLPILPFLTGIAIVGGVLVMMIRKVQ
ncbi:MFS transporter [Sporolactobacillus shoreicorticis]|uniref:MFS transporter n=1 Tax=Sporolactobacillus shoreicorticis TaxID=1923877 RepID=A0ABW5RZV2_9BACL|nr:MFS transporter [Sporolactobacillus shoreicorticis]MCO7127520.1 MFS transporter [Sporolactobacillus shoreicorticis]